MSDSSKSKDIYAKGTTAPAKAEVGPTHQATNPAKKTARQGLDFSKLEQEVTQATALMDHAAELLRNKSARTELPEPTPAPLQQPKPEDDKSSKAPWLAIGFTILERALDVMGFHSIPIAALLLITAFTCFLAWFVKTERAQRWHFKKRILVASLSAALYFSYFGYQLVKQYRKEQQEKAEKLKVIPTPAPLQTPMPTPLPQIVNAPTPSAQPTVTPAKSTRTVRRKKADAAERERREILRALESPSPQYAHAQKAKVKAKAQVISKTGIKEALSKKRTKQGLQILVEQVRKRGVSFSLTRTTEQELRSFALEHGNPDIGLLIIAVRENSPPLTVHDQFIDYTSHIVTAPRKYEYFPPGDEGVVTIEGRLVYVYQRPNIRYKQMAFYLPGVYGGFNLRAMCSHVIGKAKEWAEKIETDEAAASTQFASASSFFTWRPQVVIFNAVPMLDKRAELLEQEGHKVLGERVPYELP